MNDSGSSISNSINLNFAPNCAYIHATDMELYVNPDNIEEG